jgi:hypothetical protein
MQFVAMCLGPPDWQFTLSSNLSLAIYQPGTKPGLAVPLSNRSSAFAEISFAQ